jgi:hypothetical protein
MTETAITRETTMNVNERASTEPQVTIPVNSNSQLIEAISALCGLVEKLIESNRILAAELTSRSQRERQRWVTVERACEMLGRCDKTVRGWIKKNIIHGRKMGDQPQSRLEVDVLSIERLIASGFARGSDTRAA